MNCSAIRKIALAACTSVLAGPALAHPGLHDNLSPAQVPGHLVESPWHMAPVGLALLAAFHIALFLPSLKRLAARLKK